MTYDSGGTENPLAVAVTFLQGTLLGSIAITVAVLAVAVVGLLMLNGRFEIRRATQVILGGFIIFGASTIAGGLIGALSASRGDSLATTDDGVPDTPPVASLPVQSVPAVTDPYAGAAVPSR